MQKDRIISALIGLVGACNNNPKTSNTDQLILKALAYSYPYSEYGEESDQEILNEIYAEKNIIAPDCAFCAMPCGNTSDYDMHRIYNAPEEIRKAKLDILSMLQKGAWHLYQNLNTEFDAKTDYEVFYKALSYISYDMEQTALDAFIEELREIFRRDI